MKKKNEPLVTAQISGNTFKIQKEYNMTKEFFKEVCKEVVSTILPVIPDNESLRVYRNGDFYTIEIGWYKYTRHSTGTELFEFPEGLNDEED